ncbi:transporter [Paenibacillus profundus]|uniref:Transporter n=1 Tax=Paenibacillus profundus TaxID=1173085 RepID=A0ABS8YP00_9BACL|nr:transporter [Paenibacillus profundus]
MAFIPLQGPQGSIIPTLPPPPAFVPAKPAVSYIVDCLYQYTYVWLWNGDSFWFYPTRVEYGAVSGYRWNGLFWIYYDIDPRFINAVSCPPIPTPY